MIENSEDGGTHRREGFQCISRRWHLSHKCSGTIFDSLDRTHILPIAVECSNTVGKINGMLL